MGASSILKSLSRFLIGSSWKLRESLIKNWISIQDRLGSYAYPGWLRENQESRLILQSAAGITSAIHFGVVILVDQPGLQHLKDTLDSLQDQQDVDWVACLVACDPENGSIDLQIQGKLVNDTRISFGSADRALTEAQVIGQSLSMLHCDWITVLASGDRLSAGTLTKLAALAEQEPEADILYTDEHQLDSSGKRCLPFFKPDWSPELLLSVNYLLRAFYRKPLLSQSLSLAETFEEAIYRSAELARKIIHFPAPLVHKRFGDSPAYFSQTPSPGQVAAHLRRSGFQRAEANLTPGGHIQVAWPMPPVLVSIIIPTCDQAFYLKRCIESILSKTSQPDFELILVDSSSRKQETRELFARLQEDKRIRIVNYPGLFNFSGALNLGAHHSQGEILVFLNNDTQILDDGWLLELTRWALHPDIGIVGGKLLYLDHTIQHAGIIIGMEGHASHVFGGMPDHSDSLFGSVDWYRDYSAVTGACMAMRREVYDRLAGFDEAYQLVFSDVEICLRAIQAGYRVVYTPFVRLLHFEGKTRSRYIPAVDIQRGAAQFMPFVKQGDPFYNPNLSLSVRGPTLRRKFEQQPVDRLEKIRRYF
jgi:GT2 family glycosyltransferase